MTQGLFSKYIVQKADGSPVDPDAQYFVLWVDKDPAARLAVLTYAKAIQLNEPEFAEQLRQWVLSHEPVDPYPPAHNSLDHLIAIVISAFNLVEEGYAGDPRDTEEWTYIAAAFQQIKDDDLAALKQESPAIAAEIAGLNTEFI